MSKIYEITDIYSKSGYFGVQKSGYFRHFCVKTVGATDLIFQ